MQKKYKYRQKHIPIPYKHAEIYGSEFTIIEIFVVAIFAIEICLYRYLRIEIFAIDFYAPEFWYLRRQPRHDVDC